MIQPASKIPTILAGVAGEYFVAAGQHVDNSVRKFSDYENLYLKRWDLLGL